LRGKRVWQRTIRFRKFSGFSIFKFKILWFSAMIVLQKRPDLKMLPGDDYE
jgi:hypothetical protein